MPPGRHNPRVRQRMNGASIAGLFNADARNEEEIKTNTKRFFGKLLAIVFFLDVLFAFVVVWLSCNSQGEEDDSNDTSYNTTRWWLWILSRDVDSSNGSNNMQCVATSLNFGNAFRHAFHHKNSDTDTLGDFVVLAILRCLTMMLLLWAGVRFGSETISSQSSESDISTTNATTASNDDNDDTAASSLREPLLPAAGHPDVVLPSSNNNNERVTTTGAEDQTNHRQREGEDSSNNSSGEENLCGLSSRLCTASFWNQERIRSLVLLLVFVSCTVYQVYAGLRVATMESPTTSQNNNSNDNDDSKISTHWQSLLKIVLVCATVLWINAEAYIVRVLVLELTRKEEGLLFLPPEVHRHPLYLETDKRSMAMHWCDLCRKRIGGQQPQPTCRVVNNNNSKQEQSKEGWCYRCALCDFDICLACSKRNDAATVGENVLRGDRGVRTELSLTTSQYVQRSIAVAGKSEWPWLLCSFALLCACSLFKLFLPHFQGRIIDKVIPIPYHPSDDDNDNDDDNNHGDTYYDKKGFLHYILIYVLVMLLRGALWTLYSAIFTMVSRRLKFTIRNALLEKILAQDVAYFDGTESGRLISRLTNDLDMMMAPIQSSLSNLLSNILILVGGMVMCFAKSYRLSMLAFVTIGPISYLWEQYALWSKKLAREMLSYWAQGNSIAAQALSHIRTVKAFGCEEVVMKEYAETNQLALNCGIKDAWGNGLTSALTGYLDLGTGVLILYFGGLLVYKGEMTVGDLVTYQLFWNMMNDSYQNLQGLVTSFTRSAAGAEKVFSLWDSHPDIDPTVGEDIAPDEVFGHVELKKVSFYYQMRPDNMVLEGFDLDIPAGKTLALVGRSGGGKSTIINLLLRFYDPREGQLLLDGKPYESLKVHQLRKLFGVVTQDTELFALTVEENIAYGLDKDEYTSEEVVEAAKKAYAHDFICQMKDGYQTRIGERGSRISGGQRQRLAIARVFLRKPRIILLDEATSALDENSQEAVQKALADLIAESQSTVVMVAHRLSTVVNADSICVIDKGKVLEQGNHEELANKPGGIYASMVSKQLTKQGDLLDQEKTSNDTTAGDGKKSAKSTTSKSNAVDTIDDLLASDS